MKIRPLALGSVVLAAATLVACTHPGTPAATSAPAAAKRPNVLIILADDLGYSDIGAFGGEIPTPNLDELARQGRLLTTNYVGAACSPTRAMLMTGTDSHIVGFGSMAEFVRNTPQVQGKPGYEGYLNERVLWLPQMLRDAGYHTYMAGKWHLSNADKSTWPFGRGFESSFALLAGGAPHFAPVPGKPIAGDKAPYADNDQPGTLPPDFFSTDFFTARILADLKRNEGDGKPFFAYLAYTAPHWPLQAPDADIARFAGRYDAGYEVIRAQRLARQKALGIIPADFKDAQLPVSKDFPSWDQLTPEQKRSEARKMEVYAAMVHNMDHNIGRVISYLKASGQYDNTLIVFQSDNGAEPTPSFIPNNENNDNSVANMGRPLSNIGYGPRWAYVSGTPLRYFKGYSSEGGVSSPTIVRMPGQTASMPKITRATHVTDLAPTILEMAGVQQPKDGQYAGRKVLAMTGASLLPALRRADGDAAVPERVLAGELFAGRWVRAANWKLVSIREPFSDNRWELYDINADRGETQDLAAREPEVVKRMVAEWDRYAKDTGVVLIENKMPNLYFGATEPGLGRPVRPGEQPGHPGDRPGRPGERP